MRTPILAVSNPCTATLYAMNASGTSRTNLASTKFDVFA